MTQRVSRKQRVGHVTEDLFNKVKYLASYPEIKNNTIMDITNLGLSTVGRIKSCENYEAYKVHIASLQVKAKAPSKKELPVTLDVSVRIANALERLADAWEAHPTKVGMFKK